MHLAVLQAAYLGGYTRRGMYAEAAVEAIYVADTGCERAKGNTVAAPDVSLSQRRTSRSHTLRRSLNASPTIKSSH